MKQQLAVATFVFVSVPALAQAAEVLDPVALQASREMMEAMHMPESIVPTLQGIEQYVPIQLRAQLEQDKTLDAQQRAESLARFDRTRPAIVANMHKAFADPSLDTEIVNAMAPLYAATYTVDELHQLTAFFVSPVGQKMVAITPKMFPQILDITNQVTRPVIAKVITDAATADKTDRQR